MVSLLKLKNTFNQDAKEDFLERLEKLNQELRECQECDLAKTRGHVLCGEGDVTAKLFLVALSPGETEDRENRMFIGPSGKVLDELLKNAGIERNSLYISNLIKCNLPQNRKPKMREIAACHHYLDREIDMIKPEFIVPLGFYASRYILEKYSAHPPSARADFHRIYGNLFYSSTQKIYPLPHPASLLYRPEYLSVTQDKYNTLGIFQQPCKWYNCCPMKLHFEQGKLERKWIELYCRGNWQNCQRYQMEEANKYHADNMLPDGSYI